MDRDHLLPPVLLVLTAVTGVVDAVSYLGLGRVFTANMTGNVVLLGFAAAGTEGLSVARTLAALLAFLAGAVIGGRTARRWNVVPWHRWTGVAFGAEAILLLLSSAVVIGEASPLVEGSATLFAVIVLTAIAMGIRNATARKLAVPDLTTTVLTLTVTGIAADSRLAGGDNSGFGRRSAAAALMLAGAAVGAWLVSISLALALAVCGIISGSCALALTHKAPFSSVGS
ncbi:MAG TPA: YoaK family protein [Vicinamibacteria bacterium]|nr:YoaK family protein [Vicinamibacteria bacterium]